MKYEYSVSGMTLTRENYSNERKTCPIASSSSTNPSQTGQGLDPCLHGNKPVTNCPIHGTAARLMRTGN